MKKQKQFAVAMVAIMLLSVLMVPTVMSEDENATLVDENVTDITDAAYSRAEDADGNEAHTSVRMENDSLSTTQEAEADDSAIASQETEVDAEHGHAASPEATLDDNGDNAPEATRDDGITDEERKQAIAKGLEWLKSKQVLPYGYFEDPDHKDYYRVGLTAFAVLKFEEHAAGLHPPKNPFDPSYQYHQQVKDGWAYLSTKLHNQTLSTQPNIANIEQFTDQDGFGIYFASDQPARPTYETGIVMMALQASESPSRQFPNDPDCAVTFRDVLEDCVDWCAWAQTDTGWGRGGWYYEAQDNSGNKSDNSISQWPVLGFMSAAAPGWNIQAPNSVKSELLTWLSNSQDINGSFHYYHKASTDRNDRVNVALTASGLVQLTYCDVPTIDSRWNDARNWIGSNWADPHWKNVDNGYTSCGVMKAAMTADDDLEISGLQPVKFYGTHDWQKEYDDWLLAHQDSDGYWPEKYALPWHSGHFNKVLATEYALLILQKVVPPTPEPPLESFEDLLKSQAELLFSFEDLLNETWDELTPGEQLEFLESFEDLLKSQEKLIKSFEDLLNEEWDNLSQEDQIRYLRSFEDLLKSQEELLFSFEDLLKRIDGDWLDHWHYDPKESFEDLLKSQEELLFSFEDLLNRTWDELTPGEQLEFLESFEDLLKSQEKLIKSFEDLLNEEWDNLSQEDQIRYLRSFEDLLKSQEELLFSFEDLLKRLYEKDEWHSSEDNPTEAEIKAAIDLGVAWLVSKQNDDGSWGTGTGVVGKTGLVVKKLEHHAVDTKYGYGLDTPFDPAYPYRENIINGFNYIFANAHIYTPIVPQTYCPDVDTDSDGIGVYFVDGEDPKHRCYETGIVLMAIAESIEQNRTVNVTDSEVYGWTYHAVAQDTVDYLAMAQAETNGRGGWGYAECDNGIWNPGLPDFIKRSDNSITGYVVLGLQYAELPKKPECPAQAGFELTIPQCVKDELRVWIDYIQADPGDQPPPLGWNADIDGGSGYAHEYESGRGPCNWVNILKTGNLLKEMEFSGHYTIDHPRVTRAVDYLVRHWNDADTDPGWKGSGYPPTPSNYQSIYCQMKGLVANGYVNPAVIDNISWQHDFDHAIVTQQQDDGSWLAGDHGDSILNTVWALLTLQKVAPKEQYDPLESFEDLLKSQEELLFSFEELLNMTWDELTLGEQLEFLESFEDLLKSQEDLLKSFEELLIMRWDELSTEERIKFLRSFEDLLESQEKLLFSFEDLLKRLHEVPVVTSSEDNNPYDPKESFEDLLKSQEKLLFRFEELKRTEEEISEVWPTSLIDETELSYNGKGITSK